jgi:ubiquinone/menaquinone biosynthesis C-methylase UbiE
MSFLISLCTKRGCCLATFFILLAAPGLLPHQLLLGQEAVVPPARQKYMGRTIAATMGYGGAPWLIRETREAEERPSEVIKQLGLKPGMVVCDMGCGNGFYSLLMAKEIAPDGKVLAVDIQPEMLRLLQFRATEQGVNNVELIQSSVIDPKLPKNSVDLVLMVDVYHEFSHPVQMLSGIRECLKEDGLVALLEYRAEDPNVPIKPLHKMSKRQILKEYEANGFKLAKQYDGLPWQHLMFFGRDPDWTPPRFSTRRDQ